MTNASLKVVGRCAFNYPLEAEEGGTYWHGPNMWTLQEMRTRYVCRRSSRIY